MRHDLRFSIILLAVAICGACSPQPTAQPTAQSTALPTASAAGFSDQDAIAVADEFYQVLVVQQDFAGATEHFDDQMQAALPSAELEQVWQTLVLQFGPYRARLGEQSVEHIEPYVRVVIPLQFETAALDMQVVIDSTSGKISGLFFAPSASAYTAPAYADPTQFEEREVTFGAGEWALPGTLTLPKGSGPFPAVVLVHGSGPNDRDETLGPNKPFKDLAWGLASRGAAVLRYDKRTLVHRDQFAGQEGSFTVDQEVIDDAVSAVALLRETDGIDPDRVFVLGHSLGGMLAPRIAQADESIAGILILAGPTRPIEDLMIEQTEYILGLTGELSGEAQQQIDTLRQQVAAVKALTPADTSSPQVLLGAPPAYWLDLRDYSPAQTAAGLSQPIFVLQGERDYQVTLEDFAGWQAALSARPDVRLTTYPELNHLFMAGSGPSTPAEYQTPGHVDSSVIEDVAAWLGQQASR